MKIPLRSWVMARFHVSYAELLLIILQCSLARVPCVTRDKISLEANLEAKTGITDLEVGPCSSAPRERVLSDESSSLRVEPSQSQALCVPGS